MAGKNICTIMLKEKDLDFVLETVLPKAKDKEGMKIAIREDSQFRDSFMSNDLLFEQLVNSNQVVVDISPMFLFEILLRRSIKEMEENTHTVERSISQRIPVFDIKETLEFINEEGTFDYLVDMLASFVFCRKKTTSDINIDNLVKLGNEIESEYRFEVYKRIADICLFILGMFPEYVMYDYYYLFFKKKVPIKGELTRTMGDYEQLGQEFYRLASQHERAKSSSMDRTLELFSENFYLAKKPLNYISENFLAVAK